MRKIFYAAILILFCAIDAHAQGGAFGDTVNGPNVAIKPGAFVTICTHPSTVASCPANKITLYSDINLVTPVTNPLVTDGMGHWLAYAPSGTYDYIVTGTGITPMTVPFTFSIGGAGGACSTVLKTNGSTNTDQCLLDLTAGTNITLANVAGVTTINATGGGTGCTLSGVDQGVLSEHPMGTCFDSADFTWDHLLTNLQAGDGTNSIDGQYNFVLGEFNTTPANVTQSLSVGDNNALTYGLEQYAIGTENTISGISPGGGGDNTEEAVAIGAGNTISASTNTKSSDVYVTGNRNAITAQDCFVTGGLNTISPESGGHLVDDCGIFGRNNNYLWTGAFAIDPSDLYTFGDGNDIEVTAAHQMTQVHIFGDDNAISNTSNDTNQVEVVGEQNSVDGAVSTLQLLGYQNTATNVTSATIGDTVIVGAENAVTHVANTDNTYAATVGFSHTLQNCDNCMLMGFNGSENGSGFSNSLGIGMSATPEHIITSGLDTLNASQAITVGNAGSTGTTLHKLAKFTGTPSTAVITSTSDVLGAIGIVSLNAGTSGSASVSVLGITLCVFDGATTAGDYVNISTSTAGDCHDAGASPPSYSIGRVMSTNGGGGTYPVDLIIGTGTGGAVATQGKVALTGQTASLSPTALITTPASPALAAYRITAALSCDSSSASATVTFTLAWTDPSSTSQSITSSAATCTTLGSASYQSLSYAINVAEGTAINYSTTIANTPTYSLHVLLEGAW